MLNGLENLESPARQAVRAGTETRLEVVDETAAIIWLHDSPIIMFTKKGILLTTGRRRKESQRQAINEVLSSILLIQPDWNVVMQKDGAVLPFEDGMFFKT